ncbi:unnamed protein product [Vicia faba]|uniref:Uncharacterized protein n=1 Tax=Vicia faba TaxID=3906 RepID=A0AAV0ZDU6_VICFA|nr:unnamed protein product [Vicia faba]
MPIQYELEVSQWITIASKPNFQKISFLFSFICKLMKWNTYKTIHPHKYKSHEVHRGLTPFFQVFLRMEVPHTMLHKEKGDNSSIWMDEEMLNTTSIFAFEDVEVGSKNTTKDIFANEEDFSGHPLSCWCYQYSNHWRVLAAEAYTILVSRGTPTPT